MSKGKPNMGSPNDGIGDRIRQLPRAKAPEHLWTEITGELKRQPSPAVPVSLRRQVSPIVGIAASLVALVGGSVIGVYVLYRSPSQWNVARIAGSPTVSGEILTARALLEPGEWLTTDSASRAQVDVGRIGTATIGPNSTVRMDRDGRLAHHMTLERGTLEAVIAAPPRLFFVRTPTALATDLGCAYLLRVDDDGTTSIHVTSGWVELEQDGRTVIVPAGLVANVETGRGPGTPYPSWLPDEAREALRRIDLDGGTPDDLELVLRHLDTTVPSVTVRKERAISLWHLIQRVGESERAQVYRQLRRLSPPPEGVTGEGILTLERQTLERWRRDLSPMWSEEAQPIPIRLSRWFWDLIVK